MNALTLPALPEHLANRQVRATAAAMIQAGGSQMPPHLSTLGQRFTLVDGAGNQIPVPTFDPAIGPYLDCVIMDINEHKSKQFYGDKPYDPNNTEPPICWSDNGSAPSIGAEQPQSALCSQCPHNVRGSKISQVSGKAIKACSDRQKVAILIPQLPGHVFLFNVSPAGIGNMAAYASAVSKNQGPGRALDPSDLVTRLYFEQGTMGVIDFKAVGYIDGPTASLMDQLLAAKATDTIVGRDDIPRTGALPAPAAQPTFSQPALAPPPQPVAQQPATQQPGPAFAFPGAVPGGAAWTFQAGQPANSAGAPTASPSNGAAPAGRKRRTKAEMAAAAAGPPAGQAPLPFQGGAGAPAPAWAPVAPFLQQGVPAPAGGQPAGQNFGIQPAVAPNADIMASLQNAFNLPTR